jgi:hypothetical protein
MLIDTSGGFDKNSPNRKEDMECAKYAAFRKLTRKGKNQLEWHDIFFALMLATCFFFALS